MTNQQVQAEFAKLCFLDDVPSLTELVEKYPFMENPYRDFSKNRTRKIAKLNKLLVQQNLAEIEG